MYNTALNLYNKENELYNKDINELVRHISADVIYLDPPYNSRQYCDAYHLLENVVHWKKPKVRGVAKKMDRTFLKVIIVQLMQYYHLKI